MEPAIETSAAILSLDGGILFIRSKGLPSNPDSVGEALKAAKRLAGGRRIPVLFDARQWPGASPEGWSTFVAGVLPSFSAAAVVFDPETDPRLMLRIESMDQLLIPFRAFVDEAEARAFLLGALPTTED